jgi:MAM domain, meprin/A5/mu
LNRTPTCDFESDINTCGWQFVRDDLKVNYDWNVIIASSSQSTAKIDHTTGTVSGHFAQTSNIAPFSATTNIKSYKMFNVTDKIQCLSFWFWRLNGGVQTSEDVLQVFLEKQNGQEKVSKIMEKLKIVIKPNLY